jgi:hypothetical protein
MGRLTRCTPLAAVLVFTAGAPPTFAQRKSDPPDDGPQRCISLLNLDRTDVVDNRTILFHMRNGRIYLNHLSRECPGLEREQRFMYSPTSTQLCEVDAVTVIEKWGFGFTRGFTCSLGEFHPLSKSESESVMQTTETPSPKAPEQTRATEPNRAASADAAAGVAGSATAGNAPAPGKRAGVAAAGAGENASLGGVRLNTLRPVDAAKQSGASGRTRPPR